MAAFVAFLGAEQAQAGLVAAQAIGELGGEVFPGFLPVGHQVAQHQFLAAQVEDPQAPGGGRLRVVDDRQVPGLPGTTADCALHRTQSAFQGLGIEFRGGVGEAGVQRRAAGGMSFAGGERRHGKGAQSKDCQAESAQEIQHV